MNLIRHAMKNRRCLESGSSSTRRNRFNAHYDSHDVFILQVAGSKTFNFYGGGTAQPYAHDDFEAARHPCGESQQSLLIEAGDTMSISRGVMHDAVAGASSSLHIRSVFTLSRCVMY